METFISRLRDELLNREEFANVKEAKVLAEDYRDHYNHHRPHGALDYLTPVEFAAIEALAGQDSAPSEQLEIRIQTLIVSGTDNGVRPLGLVETQRPVLVPHSSSQPGFDDLK